MHQAGSDVAVAVRKRRAEAGEAAHDARADLVRGNAALGLTIPAAFPSLPAHEPEVAVTPSLPERPAVPAGPGGV